MTSVLIYVIPTSLLKVKMPALCAVQQRKYSFSPPFLNITNNVTIFPHMLSNSSSTLKETITTWKCKQMLSGQSPQAYSPLSCTLASYSYWKLSIHMELQNSQNAGLYEEPVDFFLFLISNQRYLKPQNTQSSCSLVHHLTPTCHKLAAENCSISPLHNTTCQGKVLGVVLQEGP